MGTGSKVLIVDDEKRILRLLSDEFEEEFQVSCAVNGAAALQEMEEHGQPDLVITDIKMPVMDGTELIRILKAENPELPVLILTARENWEIPEDIHNYPILSKPIPATKVLKAAKQLLLL